MVRSHIRRYLLCAAVGVAATIAVVAAPGRVQSGRATASDSFVVSSWGSSGSGDFVVPGYYEPGSSSWQ